MYERPDLFTRAPPRKLTDERHPVTHKFSITRHERYIIASEMYEGGTPCLLHGRACALNLDRPLGVPLKPLVDKLTNTRFEPSELTEHPSIRYAASVLDYIAHWLGSKFLSLEYLKRRPVRMVGEVVREPGSLPETNMASPKCNYQNR